MSIDEQIKIVENELSRLRAIKEGESYKDDPKFQKEVAKFKDRYQKIRNDYPESYDVEVTATFRINISNNINIHEINHWIDSIEVVESNNMSIAQDMADQYYESTDGDDVDDCFIANKKLLKDYTKLISDINKSEFYYQIKDALSELDE